MISGASSPTMCSPNSLPAPGLHSALVTWHPTPTLSPQALDLQQQQPEKLQSLHGDKTLA
jgi:hypothetical protein